MSETIEISKKGLVILALSQPGGSERSNPDLAKEIGCDAKFVRSVRAEIETEGLRAENERLRAELLGMMNAIAEDKATQEPVTPDESVPVVKTPRKRKTYVENYPLFETIS